VALPFPGAPGGDAWDELTIAGVRFLGVVEVTGAKRSVRVDERNRRGANGATVSIHGRELAKPKLTLKAWDEAGVAQLEAIAERVFPVARTARHNAVEVLHPALAFHGITQVLVTEVDGPEVDDTNLATLSLSCHEYRPPPARAASATRTPAAADAATPDDIDSRIARVNSANPIPTPPSQGAATRPPT
jgi:hypothetical protein